MGTISSIATGLVDGYVAGQKINAFKDRERQRSEAGELTLAKGRDEKSVRESETKAHEEMMSKLSMLEDSLHTEFGSPPASASTGPDLSVPSQGVPQLAPQFAKYEPVQAAPLQSAVVENNAAASALGTTPRIKKVGGMAQSTPPTGQAK